MNPAVYWRSALGLFWAFMFFVLLSLVIGMTYLSKLSFYPYAIFLSAILLLFLTAFLLFDKRIKAGWYMCIALSCLFVLNQGITLYFLFMLPSNILPVEIFAHLVSDEASLFPNLVSFFMLLWGIFLLFSTWKSKPVFEAEMKEDELKWLVQVGKRGDSVRAQVASALGKGSKGGQVLENAGSEKL